MSIARQTNGELFGRVEHLAVLSAGTPMFFMGEEKGALQDFKYNDFLGLREDLLGARNGSGAHLFRFYSDLIAFRKNSAAVRSKSIRILHHREPERMIVFRRTAARETCRCSRRFPTTRIGTDTGSMRMTFPTLTGAKYSIALPSTMAAPM